MKAAGAAWLGITGLGLILLFSGIADSGGNSQPGLIVFGALIVSMGLSGILGVAHDPDSSGSMFAVIGFIIPAYSLPFLLYYAGKGARDRAENKARYDRVLAGERAEREAGLRCPHCGLLDESGRHNRRCPDHVHEVEVVVHDSGEWLLTSGAVVRPSRSFLVRCSCGHETGKHESEAVAVELFRTFHGATSDLKVVPVVHA
jgi:hypothetical protein